MNGRWRVRLDITGWWRACCPYPFKSCACMSFDTHAEAIAYADRMAHRGRP